MEKNTFKKVEFINFLEFFCDKINNFIVTKDTPIKCKDFFIYNNDGAFTPIVTYKLGSTSVVFYDVFTTQEVFRFIYDCDFKCYYFDSSFLNFEIEDGPFYDFLLDILDNLI